MRRTRHLKLTYLLHTTAGLPWAAAWRRAREVCAARRAYAKRAKEVTR